MGFMHITLVFDELRNTFYIDLQRMNCLIRLYFESHQCNVVLALICFFPFKFQSKLPWLLSISDWQCMYVLLRRTKSRHELPFPDPSLGLFAQFRP